MQSPPSEKQMGIACPKVTNLSPDEWTQIQAQLCSERAGYAFQSATRKKGDRVVVRLISTNNHWPRMCLKLVFEKKGGRWIENTAKARETAMMAPAFLRKRAANAASEAPAGATPPAVAPVATPSGVESHAQGAASDHPGT